jgi:hypothetical protein
MRHDRQDSAPSFGISSFVRFKEGDPGTLCRMVPMVPLQTDPGSRDCCAKRRWGCGGRRARPLRVTWRGGLKINGLPAPGSQNAQGRPPIGTSSAEQCR